MKFFFTLLLAFAIASEYTFHRLKDNRKNVTFVEYSREQKLLVASSIRNLLSIFVHRKLKILDFGEVVDPLPRIDEIVATATEKNIPDTVFHYNISDIFWSLRDFHTKYAFPGPHKCYSWLQPFSFAIDHRNSVIVSAFAKQPEILDMTGISDSEVSVGDELLEVNGMSVRNYTAESMSRSGGSNAYVAFRTGLDFMVARDGGVHRIPETDSNEYLLRSRLTGFEYRVEFPWISMEYEYCLAANLNPGANAVLESSEKHFQSELHRSSFKHHSLNFQLNDTDDPIVKWGIYKTQNKALGILRILTFVGGDSTVQTIRNLLLNELKDTFALLIDLRSNPGGSLLLAEKLPQLFAPNVTSNNFIALANDINKEIFINNTGVNDPWHQSYLRVKEGDEFTPLTTFTNETTANSIGQVYVKPLSIFTNAHCYSACDMFSAAMQDNFPGLVVFGEDETTGGGGANVGTWSYLGKRNPKAFPKFPYHQNNQVAQFATVAWRQAIRVKGEVGVLIEDRGVKSDYIIRPTIEDFDPMSASNSQYERIARNLLAK